MQVDANGIRFECRTWGEGEPLLCLHGFPDDPGSFAALAESLDGYRVVAPYMRGYGPTGDAPDGAYDPPTLGADAAALGEALDARYLVGHDWGAVAAYAALAREHPFERVAAMAVPPGVDARLLEHPSQVLRWWYIWLFQFPGIAERALTQREYLLVEFLWGLWSPGWDWPEERIEDVKDTFDTGETASNAIQYYRDMINASVHAIGRRGLPDPEPDEPFDTPALVVAGRDDGCIAPALFDDAAQYFEHARVIAVGDAGHFMHCERPVVVAKELEAFFE